MDVVLGIGGTRQGGKKNWRGVDIECGVGKGHEGKGGRRNWAKRRRWIKYEGMEARKQEGGKWKMNEEREGEGGYRM